MSSLFCVPSLALFSWIRKREYLTHARPSLLKRIDAFRYETVCKFILDHQTALLIIVFSDENEEL